MKKIVFLGVSFFALLACSENVTVNDNRDAEFSSSIAAGGQSEEEMKERLKEVQAEEEARLATEMASRTSMEFDRMFHDFGEVTPGSENTTTFSVKNTGDKPLIIEDVAASCGCTTPVKPTKPIAPGESDVITVTFTPKPGQLNEQKKNVTVTANTDPKVVKLDIRAFVVEK